MNKVKYSMQCYTFLNCNKYFQSYCWLQMESLAVITYNSPFAGSALDMSGDLVLVQHEALCPKHKDNRYNHSIIDKQDNRLNLAKIYKLYSSRTRKYLDISSNSY